MEDWVQHNHVLGNDQPFLDNFVYVNLDDILIKSSDLAIHQRHVTAVLQWLLAHQIYVKAEKSEFHDDTLSFLGFIIASGKVQVNLAKVRAVSRLGHTR